MIPDRWRAIYPVGIENTNRVGFRHYCVNVRFPYPSKSGNFRVLCQSATYHATPEHKSNDSPAQVLVDTRQRNRFNDESRLFPDFTNQAFGYLLISLKNATRRFPVCVIPPLYDQCAGVLVDYDPGDTHRVPHVLTGHFRNSNRAREYP